MFSEYNIRLKLRTEFLEKANEKYRHQFDYPKLVDEFVDTNSVITIHCRLHDTVFRKQAFGHLICSGCKMCIKELMRLQLKEVLKDLKLHMEIDTIILK